MSAVIETPPDRAVPHALEAERAVLGAAMLYAKETLPAIAAVLKPDALFRGAHRRIYRTMLAFPNPDRIDATTLVDALRTTGELDDIGGPAYLASLVDGLPRSTNVEYYARIINEKAALRSMIAVGQRCVADAYVGEETPAAILDRTFGDLLNVSQGMHGQTAEPTSNLVSAAFEQLEALSDATSAAWGHRSDLQALDRRIRGFRDGRMILIAGRPGDGKSSLCLNVATAIARRGDPVLYFSLEQDQSELMLSLISAEARVNIEDLADGKFNADDHRRVSEAMELFREIPLYLDPSTDVNPISLRAKARHLQVQHGLACLVVDYVQLMQGLPGASARETENERLTKISRSLKLLAKDLNVPVIVVSQLNRAPEARTDARPQLGDLRGSGSLEQDADTVILIHDPSKAPKKGWGKRRTAQLVEEQIQQGVVNLIVAKNRGLATGVAQVLFRKEYVRFENLAM